MQERLLLYAVPVFLKHNVDNSYICMMMYACVRGMGLRHAEELRVWFRNGIDTTAVKTNKLICQRGKIHYCVPRLVLPLGPR